MKRVQATLALGLLLGAHGCDEEASRGDDGGTACAGAKCDTPTGDSDELCRLRQSEVLESSRRAFTEDSVRWSCADVEGVNTVGQDDRGQEYCEYFAIVKPPGAPAVDLGRNLSAKPGDVSPFEICVEGETASSECRTTITEDQLFEMEDAPDSVVGACVFTSWHSDVPGPLPACEGKDCESGPDVMGFPLRDQFFQMKLETNSNQTSSDVVQFCVDMAVKERSPVPDDINDKSDPFTEPFYRGCRMAAFFNLEWRRSDPAICAVANRMVECGCELPGVPVEEIGKHVVPPQPNADGSVSLRGFALGTWDGIDDLPAGCKHVETGDGSQTIVHCDLTAADVLQSIKDPKEACRQVYGHNIVAHATIPAQEARCTPPNTPVGSTCGAQPWNIGRENG